MSSYLLIGGAGVFAVHTASYLLQLPETKKVISVGRNIERSPAYTLNVGAKDPRYSYHQIHLNFELDRLMELIDKTQPEYIINYAALAYATSWEKAYRYYETNLLSVVRLCEELYSRKFLKKFIQIGTSELYGSVAQPANEDAPLYPTSPYAVSKLAADQHLQTLHLANKLPINIIRPSNAYGPGQQIWRVIPRVIYCILTDQKLPLHGGGKVKKSYFHAYDLAKAIKLVADKAPVGEIYNVGPDEPISIKDLIMMITREMRVDFNQVCEIVPGRVGEDAQYWLKSDKIKHLGWQQEISLQEGIRDMIHWGKKHLDFLHNEAQEFVLHA
ncbi:MAG: hypothetical protein A3E87_05240 [Gammaproteobacteria bacterium RIFCSPHIGHO2_12_FULL_35_23]|nr:MAG: hypothetical protein A3E87_05240 [Gammaproteobacteria bacterium RIFCSPHIGHO2_12_FULL_35_23]